jgi:hypothetical protein
MAEPTTPKSGTKAPASKWVAGWLGHQLGIRNTQSLSGVTIAFGMPFSLSMPIFCATCFTIFR